MKRLLLAALAALLALPAAAASAHPVDHAGRVVVRNLRPAFGAVVPAGQVDVIAQIVADSAIAASEIRLDGEAVPSVRGGEASHPSVAATVTVQPGEHIVEVVATDDAGRTGSRAWRFRAAPVSVSRLAGADRVGTGIEVSRALHPTDGSAGGAVLARADDFPDALAGSPLAAHIDGPVLLTPRAELADAVATELERVTPAGAPVYLLGGPDALAPAVAEAVEARGRRAVRLAGDTRFSTAAAIAAELGAGGEAFVVNGRSFADALASSVPAARAEAPILLSERDVVPQVTLDALEQRGASSVAVIGGEASVSEAARRTVDDAVDGDAVRLAGPDRFATALAVAGRYFPAGGDLALASGERFPDALAGSRHAAELGVPLLLAPTWGLPGYVADDIARRGPASATVYGGPAGVPEVVVDDLLRAVVDVGTVPVVGTTPAPGAIVHSLDTISVAFATEVEPAHSTLYVTVGPDEVPGTVGTGDFADTLVFNVASLPIDAPPGQLVPVRVRGVGYDGARFRHVDLRFWYQKLDLSVGDTGPAVRDLQNRLTAMGYWLGTPDGVFGLLTQQALTAFQKVHRLPRDGSYNAPTRQAMAGASRPSPRSSTGSVVEIDKARQVIFIARDGRTEWVFNTSTGTEKPYTYEGRTYMADTPPGWWRVSREIDGIREGNLGRLYRPKYFHPDGIAVHGSTSVPPYPASHGCARVTYPAIDFIWGANLMPIGIPVWVY